MRFAELREKIGGKILRGERLGKEFMRTNQISCIMVAIQIPMEKDCLEMLIGERDNSV